MTAKVDHATDGGHHEAGRLNTNALKTKVFSPEEKKIRDVIGGVLREHKDLLQDIMQEIMHKDGEKNDGHGDKKEQTSAHQSRSPSWGRAAMHKKIDGGKIEIRRVMREKMKGNGWGAIIQGTLKPKSGAQAVKDPGHVASNKDGQVGGRDVKETPRTDATPAKDVQAKDAGKQGAANNAKKADAETASAKKDTGKQ